jgi:hypothetical protein
MGRRTYTDDQLVDAVQTSKNTREILIKLGLAPYGGKYETVRRRMCELNLEIVGIRRVGGKRSLRTCTDAEIRDALTDSRSLAQVLSKLGVRPGGTRRRTPTEAKNIGAGANV